MRIKPLFSRHLMTEIRIWFLYTMCLGCTRVFVWPEHYSGSKQLHIPSTSNKRGQPVGADARLLWRLLNLDKAIRPDCIHIQGRLYRTAVFVSRQDIHSVPAHVSFEETRCTGLTAHYWRTVQRMYSASSHPHTLPMFNEARTKQLSHVITLDIQLWATIDRLWKKTHYLRPRHQPKILRPIMQECRKMGKPWKMILNVHFL